MLVTSEIPFYFCHESCDSWFVDLNFYFTSQVFLYFYVCFYISVSSWLKSAILNFVVI